MEEENESTRTVIKALPLTVPEVTLQRNAEKKRIKKGILSDSGESSLFEKILYLPYLDFTYQFPATKGFLSKQSVLTQGRSVLLALREVDLGFYPELVTLASHLVDLETDLDSIVQGVESTVLVSERLEDLRTMLSGFDNQLLELSRRYESLSSSDGARADVKNSIDFMKKTRETRWKMFADGLKLPSKVVLEKIELLEGNVFFIPYFIVGFSSGGESRFLVWDRDGKENEVIGDEVMKNEKFRALIRDHIASSDDFESTDPVPSN